MTTSMQVPVKFVKVVQKMMDAQERYFKLRKEHTSYAPQTTKALSEAKQLEKVVRQYLRTIRIPEDEPEPEQKELFA